MESKIDKPKSGKEVVFLPNYFRKIGLILVGLTLLFAISFRIAKPDVALPMKETLKFHSFNILLLGLFLVAWARDKVEDEMIFLLKLKAMSIAFIFGVSQAILTPYVDFIFNSEVGEHLTSQNVIFLMLFFYLLTYVGLKKAG